MTIRVMASIAGAVLLLTSAILAITLASERPPDASSDRVTAGGPMRPAVGHGMIAEGQTGTRFTDGFEILQVQGNEPAVVMSVKSVGGSNTFRLLGSMLAGPDRRLAAITYAEGYPPTKRSLGELTPAEGATLRPVSETRANLGYELLVGYEILDDTEVGHRTGLEVTYRVGDNIYAWSSPAELLYCPPPMDTEECREVAGLD